MKKTFITLVLTALTASAAFGAGIFDNLVYNLRFGYSVGGTAPMGMPASIRSLDSYKLEPNFSLGLGKTFCLPTQTLPQTAQRHTKQRSVPRDIF